MAIKLNPDQQRQPIGGHHFKENGHMLRGDTFDEVVSELATYRLNNSIPIGNPKQDVIAYYAEKFPYMVMLDEDPPEPIKRSEEYLAWRSWVWEMWKKPELRHVTTKEAAERWIECSQCPYNKSILETVTREGREVSKKAFLLRRGENIPSFVGFCACHRFDIGVASLLENPASRSEKNKDTEQPAGCWV